MHRRRLLGLGGAALSLLAGCSGETQRPTTAPPSTTATETPSPQPQPEVYLPESENGWELDSTERFTQKELGGSDGVRGYYTGPDGEAYQVIVMLSEDYAAGNARSWRCAGWQIAFALDRVAIAASTGTEQRTFTPERPPTMSQSPVPGSEDRVRELLLLSPRLDGSDVPPGNSCER